MEEEKKNKNKKLYVFLGVGAGVVLVSAFAYWYFEGRKGAKVQGDKKDLFHSLDTNVDTNDNSTAPKHPAKNSTKNSDSYTPPANTAPPSGFPLKKKSKGALVKQLQEALIKNYGKSILPKWGADGSFGDEVINALVSKNFPPVVDFVTFTKIVSGGTSSTTVPASNSTNNTANKNSIDTGAAVSIATGLKQKITSADFWGTTAELKKIKTSADYKTVNEVFRSLMSSGEEVKDISQAALDAFTDGSQNAMLILIFGKMGLKPKDGEWTVAGLGCPGVITKCETTIKNSKGLCLQVPRATILGNEVCSTGGKTTFRTMDGQELYVPTKHVDFLQ